MVYGTNNCNQKFDYSRLQFLPKVIDMLADAVDVLIWIINHYFSYTLKRTFWTSYCQNVQHDNFHETHVIIKPCHFPEAGWTVVDTLCHSRLIVVDRVNENRFVVDYGKELTYLILLYSTGLDSFCGKSGFLLARPDK